MRHGFDLGDIGEISNEPNQATRNEFEELYASTIEELYPGCDYVTRLDFMAKFTYFKVKGKLTDSIFNEMLEFIQNIYPISKGYKLPPSYYAIKKTFKTIGLGYKSIHACEHDCCLFRGKENKYLDLCPVCNTSRWKDSNTSGKKVPKKVLCYFLIIPRLQRLYKSSHTAKEMIWHATGKCTKPGKMQHPVDDRAWKKFDTMYPDFVKKPRNVRIGLVADGFNPFGNLSQAYSMWPVILTTYNLLPWLCMKESSFMPTLLIPGSKSMSKDIDVYLRPLIEDLKVLWDRKGVESINVASGQKFNIRAMVLWTIKDFPARSILSRWSGQSYKACPTCNKDTLSIRVLSKTAYVSHRRFLKKPHKWKSSLEFNGQTDNRDPPKEFGRDKIMAQLNRLPTRVKGKHPSYGSVKIKRNVHVEHNRTKRSIFYELEYWYFLTLRHNLDIMHIEKNMVEAILNTLLMNDKSKDTTKARQNLQRKKLRQFIKGVKLPDGFGSGFKHKVTDNDTNITGLKSYDCHIMMQRLLPYGLQQYLPIKVVDILCDLELIYPPALFDIMIHLVIHLPLEALEGGPIRPRWMFPFERYMKKLKGYVRNKAKPEGSIAEGYVAEEALTFKLKKVKWYVLRNSPEIDTYRSQFKSLFPNKDMKEEFPDWFGSQMSIDVARSLPTSCGGCFANRGKGKLKPNLGGRAAGRLHTRDKTRNLSLKEIKDKKAPSRSGLRCVTNKPLCLSEYPSLIDTFFVAHTVNEIFTRDEDCLIYEEMRRLEAMGTYIDDEINHLARRGKQRWHIPGVGRVLPARVTAGPSRPALESTLKRLHKKVDFMMRLFKSDSKYSDAFSQFESAGASGSGGCGDDEESADDQEDEDEDGDGGHEAMSSSLGKDVATKKRMIPNLKEIVNAECKEVIEVIEARFKIHELVKDVVADAALRSTNVRIKKKTRSPRVLISIAKLGVE
nr:hypothetical protein [Tanacetum cinerariifolium]